MVASKGFAEFLQEQLAPLGPVAMRRMFGKTGLFRDGVLFALVGEDVLYLRVDDGNRAMFGDGGARGALSYVKRGQRIELAYWPVPERLLDEPDELVAWARAALGAARRVAALREAKRLKVP
jgi:DNA transformation protein and related proteins